MPTSPYTSLDAARGLIGGPPSAIPTPALLVDLAVVRANIDEMARRMETVPAALRPHAKIHKSPVLGRMPVSYTHLTLPTICSV